MCIDVEFLFELLIWYSRERTANARYHVEHENRNSISTRNHVLFSKCVLHKQINKFFYDFPKISEYFPKIYEDSLKLSEDQTIISEHFQRLPKISEDKQRFPKPMMFQQTGTHLSFLRDYVTIAMVIFSLPKITSYFHVGRDHVYGRKLTWHFTDH